MSEEHTVRLRNRIKAIIDLVDTQNWKKVNKLCKQLLDEFPNSSMAKSTHAIVLAKQGKQQEALEIVDKLLNNAKQWVAETTTVHNITLLARMLNQPSFLERMFQAGYLLYSQSKTPDTSMLQYFGHQLFSAYIRTRNVAQQKAHAISMWRDLKDDKYFLWSVACQAFACDVTKDPNASTTLATVEKMMVLHKTQGKLKKLRELELYLWILKEQKKYAEALELVQDENFGKKLYELSYQRLVQEAELYRLLGNKEKAIEVYKQLLLEHNADEWSWITAIFDLVLSPEVSDADIGGIKELLAKLQEKRPEGNGRYRSPHLAELELQARLAALGKLASIDGQLLNQYFDEFGTKSCCARDLIPYVTKIPNAAELIESLLGSINAVQVDGPLNEQINTVYRRATAESLRRYLSPQPLSTETALERARRLVMEYYSLRQFSIEKEVTERHPGDDLLLLAAHYVTDAFRNQPTEGLAYLIEALTLLDSGLVTSKYNFQFRLYMVLLFNALGAIKLSLKQFEEMDIKQVQLDTLLYLILDSLIRHGHFNEALHQIKRLKAFHDDNKRNTAEFVLEAYKHGNYVKAKEIDDFRCQLELSLQLAVAKTEQIFLQLFSEAHSLNAASNVLQIAFATENIPLTQAAVDALQCNFDYDVMDWFALNAPKNKDISTKVDGKTSAYADELQRARLLATAQVAKLLFLLLSITNNSDAEETMMKQYLELLEKLHETVQTLIEKSDDWDKMMWQQIVQTLDLIRIANTIRTIVANDGPVGETITFAKNILDVNKTIWDELSNAPVRTIFSPNAPKFTQFPRFCMFLSRVLLVQYLVVPCAARILPAKTKPKASDTVRALLSDARSDLRALFNQVKSIFTQADQRLTKETSPLAPESYKGVLSSDTLTIFGELKLNNTQILVDGLLESVLSSQRDSAISLSLAIKEKVKEMNNMKL